MPVRIPSIAFQVSTCPRQIARIDRDLQKPQLRQAQDQLAQAQTAVNLAAKEEARYRELLDAARADLLKNDQNKAAQLAAREQVEALKSQLDAVNVNLEEPKFARLSTASSRKNTSRKGN